MNRRYTHAALCALTMLIAASCGGGGGESEPASDPAVQAPLNPGVETAERAAIEAGVYGATQVAIVASIAGDPLQQLAFATAQAKPAAQDSDGSFGSCPKIKVTGSGSPTTASLTFPNCTPAGTTLTVDGAAIIAFTRSGERSVSLELNLGGLTINGNTTTGELSGDLTLNGEPRTPGSTLSGILSLSDLSFTRSGVPYSAEGIAQLVFVLSGEPANPIQQLEISSATINSNAGANAVGPGGSYVINGQSLVIEPARGTIPSAGQAIVTEPDTGTNPRTTVIVFNSLSPLTGIVQVTITEGNDSHTIEYDLLP